MITGRWWVVNGAPPGALGIPGRVRPGEWLRNQRVGAGLTQEDLAERSGGSVRAMARALGLPETAAAELVARYRAGGVASGEAVVDERAKQAGAGGGGAG